MISKQKIITYISIIIVIKIILFSLFFLYSTKAVKQEKEIKKLKIYEVRAITRPSKKMPSKEEIAEQKNKLIQWRLEEKMKTIYTSSLACYDKNKSKEANLKRLKKDLDSYKDVDIFIANFYEETLYGSNNYKDINARTIVLEEIQKVRRRGEGLITSDLDSNGLKRYVLVKNLNFLDLYIGINIIE